MAVQHNSDMARLAQEGWEAPVRLTDCALRLTAS
jgi:hypothetical protein